MKLKIYSALISFFDIKNLFHVRAEICSIKKSSSLLIPICTRKNAPEKFDPFVSRKQSRENWIIFDCGNLIFFSTYKFFAFLCQPNRMQNNEINMRNVYFGYHQKISFFKSVSFAVRIREIPFIGDAAFITVTMKS
jgi:hypothetical protein